MDIKEVTIRKGSFFLSLVSEQIYVVFWIKIFFYVNSGFFFFFLCQTSLMIHKYLEKKNCFVLDVL